MMSRSISSRTLPAGVLLIETAATFVGRCCWTARNALVVTIGLAAGGLQADPPPVLDVGGRKQLFIDDKFIATQSGVELVMNPPYQTGEILIKADEPHEKGGHVDLLSSVLKETDGPVRIWYDLVTPNGPGPWDHLRSVCYAESADGVQFVKPKLGLHEVQGSTANNVVLPGVIGGSSVWIDPKALREHRFKNQSKVYPSQKFHMHSSPDGIHWSFFAEIDPKGPHDTQNIIFWDDRLQRYLFFGRHRLTESEPHVGEINGMFRSVRRAELTNLTEIENTGVVMWPDAVDRQTYTAPAGQVPVDYYGATVFPYGDTGDVYIMLAQAFWHWIPVGNDKVEPGMRDVRLAVSRDSKTFTRVAGRRPFMRPGLAGAFDSKQIWALPNPVIMGDEIWIYYTGMNWDRADRTDPAAPGGQRLSGIGRAIMRLDGFVSLDAPYAGGEFTTPLLKFEGSRLELNVDTAGGGSVRVEILSDDGRPIPGLSGDASSWLVGNSVKLPVPWPAVEVNALAGKPVRLRFVMRDAKLYAFQFKP